MARVMGRVGLGIRNCTNPCWVSKLIIMVIKKSNTQCLYVPLIIEKSNTQLSYITAVLKCFWKKIKYSVIIYNCSSQMFLKKNSNIHLKQPGLCQFFHETWCSFEVFEIPGPDGSLNPIF
jgi:hypothetical protein